MPRRRRPEENISKSYLYRCAKKRTIQELENIKPPSKRNTETESRDETLDEDTVHYLINDKQKEPNVQEVHNVQEIYNVQEVHNVQEIHNGHLNEHILGMDFDIEYRYSESEVDSEIDDASSNANILCDEDIEEEEFIKKFESKLKNWAMEFKVFHNCLKSLLTILKEHTKIDLPKDPRTLLGTPRITHIENMGHGQYCHIGLTKAVEEIRKIYQILT